MKRHYSILSVTAMLVLASSVIATDREPVADQRQEQTVEWAHSLCFEQSMEFAQLMHGPFMQPPHRDGHGTGRGMPFMKRRERLERLRMKKMLEVLELEPQQRDRLLDFVKQYRKEMVNLFAERSMLIDRLADGIHSDVPKESKISGLLGEVELLEKKQYEHRAKFMRQAKKLLSAEQLARLLVFQEHFEANIFEKLRGMRQHNPRMQNRGPQEQRDSAKFYKQSTDG